MPALVSHEIPAAAAWSVQVRRGRVLRLTAQQDRANCSTFLYAAGDPVDRLNIPDTLKAQMSARIHPPMVLMSDRGVGLASVVGSTLDWHDALGGHSTDAHVARFGPSSYGADRNEWRRSARAGVISELTKHGRDAAHLHACVNFFSKLAVGDDGGLGFVENHAEAGDWVTLRAEVDLLVILSTAPHPSDPVWQPGAVLAEVLEGESYGDDDPSLTFRAESARALIAAKGVFA
ncbi:urea amidolyase associated protein UAAP1 [Actinokineospora sp. HUAS TT18]|uniref:urea amidolyase associated protein UAAP1 n=1 Tax=Actinokineospora sp. HUAS TT18 TaxID=3447451 RepID=UPI003F51FC29